MEDIRLAIGLIGFISVAVFAIVYRLLRTRSVIFLTIMAAIDVVLILVYVVTVWGQLWIVNWIPLPSVIVLANWFPPLLGALAAIVWLQMKHQSVARRLPIMCLMVVAAVVSVMYFIPAEAPKCEDRWVSAAPVDGRPIVGWSVCLQTTPNTCSAAAAATILNTLDIKVTEQEMARLCLTRIGTTWLGLYHGLATKLLGTKYRAEFFEGDVDELREMAKTHPVLLCCQLDEQLADMVPAYVEEGGWIPGVAHSTVYFGETEGGHIIGDPTRGLEIWQTRDLNLLWTGKGLRIVSHKNGQAIQ
jgi:hypothetical protein